MARKNISLILGEDERVEGKFGDNMNALIVGPPGGGKTYSVISPNIVKNNGCSMFIDDKKGNLYNKHKAELERDGYKVFCFNLINFSGDMKYNPFSGLKDRDDVHKLVNILFPDSKAGQDPYWLDSSRELAEALIDILMLSEKEVTFKSLINLLYKTGTGRKVVGGIEIPADDYVDSYITQLKAVGKRCAGMEHYKSLKDNAIETWRCVRASCISVLSAFDSDNFAASSLCSSSFLSFPLLFNFFSIFLEHLLNLIE